MSKEVYTRREAAEYIGLGESTLERWAREGRGPKVTRLSARRVGYRKGELDAWLKAQDEADQTEAA